MEETSWTCVSVISILIHTQGKDGDSVEMAVVWGAVALLCLWLPGGLMAEKG